MPIIIALSFKIHRFEELKRQIEGITPRMLSKELKELEINGLVKRKVFDTIPASIEYSLTTDYGKSLDTKNNLKMKNNILIILLFFVISNSAFSQAEIHNEKVKALEPYIGLGILDKQNSDKSITIDHLDYDEIPKSLDFRGTVVEALKWTDSNGENILIQTVSGSFNWKDYNKNSTEFTLQDKSELYVYLFEKSNSEKTFKKKWRVYDYIECFGEDFSADFKPKATTITDLDNDGTTEVTMTYVLMCRGGMDPGILKIIMFEGPTKYELSGETMIGCGHIENPYGGEFIASDNLPKKQAFNKFLKAHWDRNKCEE